MNEKLLQFIWRYQYLNFRQLTTLDGELLEILHPGMFHSNQGPDFLEAKIKIGKMILVGHLELHVNTSDWYAHKHDQDPNYANIILHVVWLNDLEQKDFPFPILELQPYVSTLLITKYEKLMLQNFESLTCQPFLPVLSSLEWVHWKERLVVERIERKSALLVEKLNILNQDWQALFWIELAGNFGMKVNGDFFRMIAASIPWQILSKQGYETLKIEAILMGQAGLLNNTFQDEYPLQLQNEYVYLKQKYNLVAPKGKVDFLRMRPQNFPTIRLSQLAQLLSKEPLLFSKSLDVTEREDWISLFSVNVSAYWWDHFVFDKIASSIVPKTLGMNMIENILINTIVPILYTYGKYFQKEVLTERALHLLEMLQTEKNHILSIWKNSGMSAINSLESQALLELYKCYCVEKRCLDCAVGARILKS